MAAALERGPETTSPLEEFIRDYVETLGGAWEEVEPQVYDLLLPGADGPSRLDADGQRIQRIAYDPEALPEHPGAQLASFGTPLVDEFLADAVDRGRYARFYFLGLNPAPHDLETRVRRAVTVAANLDLRLERARALYFAQVVFWFQTTFVSDQKEQEILPVAVDLHHGRRVRHLEKLLDRARLSEQPAQFFPEARRQSVASALPRARDEVLTTLAALANTRARELRQRLDRQVARMTRYYADLRSELDDQGRRARGGDEAQARVAARRQAVDHEEKLRIAELRQKNSLRLLVKLLQVLVIEQPKLLVHAVLTRPQRPPAALQLVWDPLLETVEAVTCPECRRPGYSLGLTRTGRVLCQACAAKTAAK